MLQLGFEAVAAGAFDGGPDQRISKVGIGHLRARWTAQPHAGDAHRHLAHGEVAAQVAQVFAGQAGLVAEQPPQGDIAVGGGRVGMKARTHMELAQGLLDRRIQGQPLLLHQLQGCRGGQQFGNAAGAKRRVRRDRHAPRFVGQAEAARPDQFLAIDHGNRQAGHVVARHVARDTRLQVANDGAVVTLGNRRRGRRLPLATETAEQATQQRNTAQCAKHEEHPDGRLDARMLGKRGPTIFASFVGKLSKTVNGSTPGAHAIGRWILRGIPRTAGRPCAR